MKDRYKEKLTIAFFLIMACLIFWFAWDIGWKSMKKSFFLIGDFLTTDTFLTAFQSTIFVVFILSGILLLVFCYIGNKSILYLLDEKFEFLVLNLVTTVFFITVIFIVTLMFFLILHGSINESVENVALIVSITSFIASTIFLSSKIYKKMYGFFKKSI
ncbi:hypothetical protein ACN5ZK_13375 (plasmid) [Macrococcoides bohemicum]|uniref:hypothetical protein n=1 Tax=Macrococcoides bohemicum TaxID=1903056 RepID=UPI003AFFC500